MRQLCDDTHFILDGEVRVYRRERSKRWLAAFVIDGHTVRISTGKRDLSEAKEYARDSFFGIQIRSQERPACCDQEVLRRGKADHCRHAQAVGRRHGQACL